MYAYFRRFPQFGSFVSVFLSLSLVLPLRAETPLPSAVPELVAPSALAMPVDFAPSPLAVPSVRANQQRRLAGLLRGFEAVQSAEVLLTGGPAQEVSAQVLLKRRAGRELPPEVLQSLVRVLTEACPGLQPARLTMVESTGKLLYAQGQVQTPSSPAHRRSPIPWLLGALFVGLALALVSGQPWKRRSPGPDDPLDFLKGADAGRLQKLLSGERPEVVAVLARQVQPRTRRRIEACLQGQPLKPPQQELEGAVRDALLMALRRKHQRL